MKNHYKTLGLTESASAQEIKKAFRKLAVKHHPDKNPDKDTSAIMQGINEAYAVLSNEKLKAEYDKIRKQPKSNGSGFRSQYEDQRRRDQYAASQGSGGYQFEGWDEFIARSMDFFGQQWGNMFGISNQKGADLEAELYLTPHEAMAGCTRTITFEREGLCPSCYGNSVYEKWYQCSTCKNIGKVIIQRELVVNIPPGTKIGSRLRLKQEGSDLEGEIPGDLYLNIIAPKAVPDDPTLHETIVVNIDLQKAWIGGPVIVHGPSGPIRIKAKPKTYPGKTVRVVNEGHMKGNTRGHLFVKFMVDWPMDPTRTEQDRINELRDLSQLNNRTHNV